jgi:hypothetical protein
MLKLKEGSSSLESAIVILAQLYLPQSAFVLHVGGAAATAVSRSA